MQLSNIIGGTKMNIIEALKKSILFQNFTERELSHKLEEIDYSIRKFAKGEVIALEGTDCSYLSIVLKGSTEIQKIYPSGKIITIDKLTTGHIFGEAVIFSNQHSYPATIISSVKTQVMFISKENIIKLCSSDNEFLSNFMTLLSNKILMLNSKLKSLSYKSIKQKIAHYILEEYYEQRKNIIQLKGTKKEIAEQLGIPRPSLSRELINMKEKGIIEFNNTSISILNFSILENILAE